MKRPEMESSFSHLSPSRPSPQIDEWGYRDAFEEAAQRIAPAWDLRDYVAVNPLYGVRDKHCLDGFKLFEAATGSRLLPGPSYFREKFRAGEIEARDLKFAVEQFRLSQRSGQTIQLDQSYLLAALNRPEPKGELIFRSLIDLQDVPDSEERSQRVTAEVSKWLSAFFDEGQSTWRMPCREEGLFRAWKRLAQHDTSLKQYSIAPGAHIAALAGSSEVALFEQCSRLEEYCALSHEQWVNYFFRLLCSVQGWAAYLRKSQFERTRSGDTSTLQGENHLLDLLVMRMAYDLSILEKIRDFKSFRLSLRDPSLRFEEVDPDYIWLLALEQSKRRRLLRSLCSEAEVSSSTETKYALAFCIDVRSEVVRRHIERVAPEVRTIGFAGFFGVPMSLRGANHAQGTQQCPVLLEPAVEVGIRAARGLGSPKTEQFVVGFRRALKTLYSSMNSCFSYVETLWPSALLKLIWSSNCEARSDRLPELPRRYSSTETSCELDVSSLPLTTRADIAENALRNMNLVRELPSYVVFFGHASESTNNPHAGALDCGACAGHSGLPNAQALAAILNDTEVRLEIEGRGKLSIPKDTLFLAGLHNTTLDILSIQRPRDLQEEQEQDLEELEEKLSRATEGARCERGRYLSFSEARKEDHMLELLERRARDWSEVRPEWGLAGNQAFIVAPRSRTRELDLGGQVFLHEYDAEADTDGSILELIMTAPMLVTNWINMQYYASTLDPRKFGAGNKTLHNVVGTFGLIEGNSGDLLTGLSEQSTRYAGKYVHDPVRLDVLIEATPERISGIIERHKEVKDLVDNHWLSLVSIDPDTDEVSLYQSDGWLELSNRRRM